jgi:sec-independent protein translocase protein TatA
MPGFVGLPEILLLGLVVLLVFGPKRLPEMGRSMGRGFREFRDSIGGDKKDEHDRFAIPVEGTEPVLATAKDELKVGERTLSRYEREDGRAA